MLLVFPWMHWFRKNLEPKCNRSLWPVLHSLLFQVQHIDSIYRISILWHRVSNPRGWGLAHGEWGCFQEHEKTAKQWHMVSSPHNFCNLCCRAFSTLLYRGLLCSLWGTVGFELSEEGKAKGKYHRFIWNQNVIYRSSNHNRSISSQVDQRGTDDQH